jgi:Tol biopolymer transport system component
VIRASLLCAIVALAVLGAEISFAAFPGKPGPIAYSKVSTDEVGEGSVESVGGLFSHGPRAKQRPHRLTSDTGDHSPSYSADGRLIVFVHDDARARTNSIYVMRNDGSERREVTVDGLGGSNPHFFPSGEVIAFARRVDGHSQIFTIRLDGSGLRQLTSGPHDNYDPAVSPNGTRIAFTSNRDPSARSDRSDIFAMRADGSRQRMLLDGRFSDYDPDFAPDGRRIAFASNRGPGASSIFVAGANGAHIKRLTRCRPFPPRCRSYANPAFSPDGKHIVVLSTGTRSSSIELLRSNRSGSVGSFDDAGTEEEGFGSNLGPPTWGAEPR